MPKDTAIETPSLASVLQSANRKYGKNTIGISESMEILDIERIPTGLPKLDQALGGGFVKGSISELYGPLSSGKSLISFLTIAQAQKMGLETIYFDVESAYDEFWVSKLGVNTKKLVVSQMSIGEDIIDLLCKLLDANPGVIVIDSVAAILTQNELEDDTEKLHIAPIARLLSYGLKKITAHNKNTCLIFINQLRDKITNFGAIPYTPGGKMLPYMSTIRVEVKKDSQLLTVDGKKTSDPVGQICNWKITKNKSAPPQGYGSFRYYFDAHIEE